MRRAIIIRGATCQRVDEGFERGLDIVEDAIREELERNGWQPVQAGLSITETPDDMPRIAVVVIAEIPDEEVPDATP